MKALINGLLVEGTPEEIDKYRRLVEQNNHNPFYNIDVNDVPEHVKKYGDDTSYVATDKNNKYRAWF